MKNTLFILLILSIISCKNESEKQSLAVSKPVNEKLYVELGGVEQYVEIIGTSDQNPLLLFVHGGPAWPQTPQLRYFNSELTEKYTLVIWEQRGAGNSFKKNPSPGGLSLAQIVADGHELTNWLKEKYQQEKVYLAGYSWGSLVGVQLVKEQPENYKAYYGVAQFINKDEGMRISRNWLREKATEIGDQAILSKIDSLENPDFYADEHERFFQQYLLVNDFKGALHNTEAIPEVEKAQSLYEDYKDYDWYGVWEISSKVLQKELDAADVRAIKQLEVPVILFQGRHDWNVPSILAEKWLSNLEAPQKEIVWFENSGHGPLEEEPKEFNKAMLDFLEVLN